MAASAYSAYAQVFSSTTSIAASNLMSVQEAGTSAAKGMNSHARTISNPIVQSIHRAQSGFWSGAGDFLNYLNGNGTSSNGLMERQIIGGTAPIPGRAAIKTGGKLLGAGKFPRIDYKFSKHTSEWSQWGAVSKTAYYKRAASLAESQVGGKIMGFTSKQGWTFRFNSATGEFLTTHPKGYIETFFRPKGGMNYF